MVLLALMVTLNSFLRKEMNQVLSVCALEASLSESSDVF